MSYVMLSRLMSYPTQELLDNLIEIEKVCISLDDISAKHKKEIQHLIEYLESATLLELQGKYVDAFDMNPDLSLHITHHLYGEEAARGTVLADLSAHYQSKGFQITKGELPDFLPLILEFLSVLPKKEALEFINQASAALEKLKGNLRLIKSPYTTILDILTARSTRIPILAT